MIDGLIAGAVGTCALDVVTYLDLAVRGRPASKVPRRAASRLAKAAGVRLGKPSALTPDGVSDREIASNRRSGIGALLGYLDGLTTGALYALPGRRVPLPLGVGTLSLAAMLGGDLPSTVLGVTNPKEWTPADWLSDLIPHLVYGLAAAYTYERLQRAR